MARVAQRGGGVTLLGGTRKPSGHGPGQPPLGGPASAGGLDTMASRGPFEPWSFCGSVKKIKHLQALQCHLA